MLDMGVSEIRGYLIEVHFRRESCYLGSIFGVGHFRKLPHGKIVAWTLKVVPLGFGDPF